MNDVVITKQEKGDKGEVLKVGTVGTIGGFIPVDHGVLWQFYPKGDKTGMYWAIKKTGYKFIGKKKQSKLKAVLY